MSSLISSSRRRRKDRQTPSVAFRAGLLGVIAVLLFAVLLFRIWFLQILSGEQYVAMAEDNRIRYVAEEAPRGIIYDRNKQPLVENRAGLAVTIFPAALKDPQQEIASLSQIIQVSPADIQKQLDLHKEDTFSSVVVKKDITPEMKSYLIERIPLYFPGVDIKKSPLRSYPLGLSAAHLLGHVGQIGEEELKEPRYEGYKAGDEIGKDGVEFQFDRYLKGIDGGKEVEVDAAGRPKREVRSIKAQAGNNVVLSIDNKLQKVVEDSLAYGVDLAHKSNYPANAAAAVVMNPKTGEILSIASYPSFNPALWVGGINDKDYAELTADGNNDPLLNRAIAGQYPSASTFKVITGIAGLQEGMVDQATSFNCTGVWDALAQPFKCWGTHGPSDLRRAIVMSCDTYFYNVGYRFYQAKSQGMQKWAREMGLGRETGIDLPGEAVGRVPDPEWKQRVGETEVDQMWLPGDSVNLSIGQGDVLVTPIQIATVYAAIANGGKVVRPHVGLRVEDQVTGKIIADLQPKEQRDLGIAPENLRAIQEGLVSATGAGSAIGDVFVGFTPAVAGKSGTAQVVGKTDYAWYAAYAPANDPQIVAVVIVEQGGGGSKSAAPAVRKILEYYFPQPVRPASPAGGAGSTAATTTTNTTTSSRQP